jgi:hypothetical protein
MMQKQEEGWSVEELDDACDHAVTRVLADATSTTPAWKKSTGELIHGHWL